MSKKIYWWSVTYYIKRAKPYVKQALYVFAASFSEVRAIVRSQNNRAHCIKIRFMGTMPQYHDLVKEAERINIYIDGLQMIE